MNASSGPPRPTRPIAWLLAATLTVAAALVVVATPAPAQAADDEWPMTVTTDADPAPAGSLVTFTLAVTAEQSAWALADIEVYSVRGDKAFQFFWDAQQFTAGRTRTYTTSWDVPSDLPPGTYHVKAGIFRVGWGQVFAWSDNADTVTITSGGAPTTTTTVRPTTTTLPATTTTLRATTTTAAATTTTTPAPTTTTTSPATTTTVRPTSTTTTTTVRPTTTTAPAPTTTTPPATTQPPAGTVFFEDFATSAGFYSRFDFGLSAQSNVDPALFGDAILDYEGDHNMACSGPAERRNVHLHPGVGPITPTQVTNQTGKSQMFWWCAPGDDATKGHMMTATNGPGYQIAYFSPKQAFTNVSRVCWDQNATTMAAKWTNVVIVPVADVEAVQRQKGFLDLGFDPPGFQDPTGPTTMVVGGPDHVGVKVLNGNVSYWEGASFVGDEEFFGGFASTDKATRFQHCMIDDGNGTVRVTQARPDGTTRTRTFRGSFPDGQVRVVFEDDMYDPPKRDGYRPDTLTWHWDNIQIA